MSYESTSSSSSISAVEEKSTITTNKVITHAWLGYNSHLIRHVPSSTTVLIDPLFCGDLIRISPKVFIHSVPKEHTESIEKSPVLDFNKISVIILTFEKEDHLHELTLKTFFKHNIDIPIIATPSAKSTLSKFQFFKNVQYLSPGHTIKISPILSIHSLKSSSSRNFFSHSKQPMSPLITFDSKHTIYLDPHNIHDFSALGKYSKNNNIDVVISTYTTTTIPKLFNFKVIEGIPSALKLCQITKPKVCFGYHTLWNPMYGSLAKSLHHAGEPSQMKQIIEDSVHETQVITTDSPLREFVVVGEEKGKEVLNS